MPKSKKKKKVRNWHALNAIILNRKIGGPRSNKKKEKSKKACRKFFDWIIS